MLQEAFNFATFCCVRRAECLKLKVTTTHCTRNFNINAFSFHCKDPDLMFHYQITLTKILGDFSVLVVHYLATRSCFWSTRVKAQSPRCPNKAADLLDVVMILIRLFQVSGLAKQCLMLLPSPIFYLRPTDWQLTSQSLSRWVPGKIIIFICWGVQLVCWQTFCICQCRQCCKHRAGCPTSAVASDWRLLSPLAPRFQTWLVSS